MAHSMFTRGRNLRFASQFPEMVRGPLRSRTAVVMVRVPPPRVVVMVMPTATMLGISAAVGAFRLAVVVQHAPCAMVFPVAR